MNAAPNSVLFNSGLWKPALEKYAEATHLTVELFDAKLRVVLGPIFSTPLFQIFHESGYDPGLFAQCARKCIIQTDKRPAVLVYETYGLATIGASLMLNGEIVGAAVAGYALVDFSQISEIQIAARNSGIHFERLWRVAREQNPVPRSRLTVYGELLQVLGDAVLLENYHTRQHEHAAQDLEQIVEQRTSAVRELSAKLLHARDDEARRIARELHDGVGQYLAHAKMGVEVFLENPDTSQKSMEGLSHVAESIDACFAEVRTISHLLHPPLLDDLGLASATASYAEGFSKRSGIQVNLEIPPELKRPPALLEIALFRILQESLTNVFRHAGSKSVDIRIQHCANQIVLAVRDRGKGIPAEMLERFRTGGAGAGTGLNSIRERVADLGGQLEVQSDDTGTLIRAALPLSVGGKAMAATDHVAD